MFVVVGQVLHRYTKDSVDFNCKVGKRNQYLKVVLKRLLYCYYWRQRGFWNCKQDLYLSDGVRLNSLGNYKFMRSVSGAILKALILVAVSQVDLFRCAQIIQRFYIFSHIFGCSGVVFHLAIAIIY